jgi:hypothetical protein
MLVDYLSSCLSILKCIIILDDFNRLNTSRLKHNYNLQQLLSTFWSSYVLRPAGKVRTLWLQIVPIVEVVS